MTTAPQIVTVYHGTYATAADSIRQQGLLVPAFVTTERHRARHYAWGSTGYSISDHARADDAASGRPPLHQEQPLGIIVAARIDRARMSVDPSNPWLEPAQFLVEGGVAPEEVISIEQFVVSELAESAESREEALRFWYGQENGKGEYRGLRVCDRCGHAPANQLLIPVEPYLQMCERCVTDDELRAFTFHLVYNKSLVLGGTAQQAYATAIAEVNETLPCQMLAVYRGQAEERMSGRSLLDRVLEDVRGAPLAVEASPFDALDPDFLAYVSLDSPSRDSELHGRVHAAQVAKTGMQLCALHPAADRLVVLLFALLHDSQRLSDDDDPGHGERAAAYLDHLADETPFLALTEPQRSQLTYALIHHDAGMTSDDPTIGACFDADRLDLPRVGIAPNPALMSTHEGRRRAGGGRA